MPDGFNKIERSTVTGISLYNNIIVIIVFNNICQMASGQSEVENIDVGIKSILQVTTYNYIVIVILQGRKSINKLQ